MNKIEELQRIVTGLILKITNPALDTEENIDNLISMRHDMQKMIDQYLGTDYPVDKVSEILVNHGTFHVNMLDIVYKLEQELITPKEYFDRLMEISRDTYGKINDCIGEIDFVKLFEVSIEWLDSLIDPKIFFGSNEDKK